MCDSSMNVCLNDSFYSSSRKNARLKYTIDRMGLENYKAEVEKLLGYPLAPVRPYTFDRNIDDFGWHKGSDGKHHFLAFIENGRVQDEPGKEFKTGLREIAKVHKGTFRLTANQHLSVSDIPEEDLVLIKGLLRKYKLDQLQFSGLRLSSSACVAFPTCGLAMAESERVRILFFCCVLQKDLLNRIIYFISTSLSLSTKWRRSARRMVCGMTPL